MRHAFAAFLLFGASALAPLVASGAPSIAGTWEAAHQDNNERLYIVLRDGGKGEIVTEYDVPMPGKQRLRSVTYAKWTRKGNDVAISYAEVTDHLRYIPREPLSAVGLNGTAPALRPTGKINARSKIGSEVLWKAPHDYHLKAGETGQPPSAPDMPSESAK